MAKKGTTHYLFLGLKDRADRQPNSEITNNDRPSYLHGHDRLLQNNGPTANPPTAEYAQIRPRGAEKGALLGGHEGRKGEVIPILYGNRWLKSRKRMCAYTRR